MGSNPGEERATGAINVPNVVKAAKVAADGLTYTIELVVRPATFGVTSFGATVGFDVSWNDGVGDERSSEVVWFKKCGKTSGCGCPSGDDAPYCDSRQFGAARLLP